MSCIGNRLVIGEEAGVVRDVHALYEEIVMHRADFSMELFRSILMRAREGGFT